MKRMILVCVMILCLVPVDGWTEGTTLNARGRTEEAIWVFIDSGWAGEVTGILRYAEYETYTETILGAERDNGGEFVIESTAIMRVDSEVGNVIYFRLQDYQMPEWLSSADLFVLDDSNETMFIEQDQMAKWLDWAEGVYTLLHISKPYRSPELLKCADETCCVFAFFHNSNKKDMDAAIIAKLPSAGGEKPQMMAYVDMKTNPISGYDGYLTADQATAIGKNALRDRFGDDAVDYLILEEPRFILYDYSISIDISTDEEPDAGFQSVVINDNHPTWALSMD